MEDVIIVFALIFVLKLMLLLAYLFYRHQRNKRKREEQMIRENRNVQENGRALCVFVDSSITSTDLTDTSCGISEKFDKPPSYDALYPT